MDDSESLLAKFEPEGLGPGWQQRKSAQTRG